MHFKPFYNYCIYCDKKLPPHSKRKGDGEHIIPRNIFGFWKSRDVCQECITYFNENVDDLPLNNLDIINAVKSLGLDDKKIFDSNLKYKGIDLFNNKEIKFITKNGKPVIKNIVTDNFFQSSEEDFDTRGIEFLKKDVKKDLPKELIEKELKELSDKYKKAEYGEHIKSELLEGYIRKGAYETIELDTSNLKSIIPLIAKINIASLFMMIPREEHSKIEEFDILRSYSRYGGELPEFLITFLPQNKDNIYKKYHIIRIRFFDRLFLIDVCLFGNPNWKTNLHLSEKITYKPPLPDEDDLEFNEFLFVLDFENLDKRIFRRILKNTNTNERREFIRK